MVEKPKLARETKAPCPDFIEPQLPALVLKPPKGPAWLHKIKYDGYRVLVHIENGKAKVFTRRKNNWTKYFRNIADSITKLKVPNALLDGEMAVVLPNGLTSFHALQTALGANDQAKIHFYAFDLLCVDGERITHWHLSERKKKLRSIIPRPESFIHYVNHIIGTGEEFFHQACLLGLEGIVSKQITSRYKSGRNRLWVKTKCSMHQEFVIGGYVANRGSLAALLLGYYENNVLQFAGSVGTGFTEAEAKGLLLKLGRLKRKNAPFMAIPAHYSRCNWVEPRLVCQVKFQEWTPNGRLRHPSYKGLRADKLPEEITRELPKPSVPKPRL